MVSPALPELAAEADKVMERHLANMETIREKSESSMTLGTAALGAALAIVSLSVANVPASLDVVLVALVALGGIFNLLALFFLLRSSLATRTSVVTGHSAAFLAASARDPAFTKEDLLRVRLESWPQWYEGNAKAMNQAVSHRVLGLRLLMLAMAFYSLAFLYILWVGTSNPPKAK